MGWLIDDVDIATLAFNVINRSAGWKTPARRGENLSIPGRHGTQWVSNKPFDQGTLNLSMWVNGATEDGYLPTDRSSYQQCRDNLDKLTALFATGHRLIEVTQISGSAFGVQNVMTNPGFEALAPTGTRTYRNLILNPAMRRTGTVTQTRNMFANPNVITGQSPLWNQVFENVVPDPYAKYQRTSATLVSPGIGNYMFSANFENYNNGDVPTYWTPGTGVAANAVTNATWDRTANPLGGTLVLKLNATAALAANAMLGTRSGTFFTTGGNGKPMFRCRARRATGTAARAIQVRLSTMNGASGYTTVGVTGTWQTFNLPPYSSSAADWIDVAYDPGTLVADATNYGIRVEIRTNEAWAINEALILDCLTLHSQGHPAHPSLVGTVYDNIPGPFWDGTCNWSPYFATAGNALSTSRWDVNHDSRWVPAAPVDNTSAYWALADRPNNTDASGTTLGFIAYGFTTGGTQVFTLDCLAPTQIGVPYTLYATARALTGANCTIDLLKKGINDTGYVSCPGTPITFTGSATGVGTGQRMTGATSNYYGQTYTPQTGDLLRVKVTVPVQITGHHVLQLLGLAVTTSPTAVYSGDTGNTANSQYGWDGTTYNSRSTRSHRFAKRLIGVRNVMVTTANPPTGYSAAINVGEIACLADGTSTSLALEQITLPATNRGLYIRGTAIGNTTGFYAAGTPNPSARVEATFVDGTGATLSTVVGSTVALNLSASNTFLPVTLSVPPESIPSGAVGVRAAFVMINPLRATSIQVGEIGVYDSAVSPARLGMPADYFSNTPTAHWVGPADDSASDYWITAPLGYTTGSGVPYPITGALAAKSSLANSATVTLGHPLGDSYPGGRYLAGAQAACRAEDATGAKLTSVPIQLSVGFYLQGVQVGVTANAQLSGNEVFDMFQGTYDVPSDFDEVRLIFTAPVPPSSITAEIQSFYLFDDNVMCPLPALGGNKIANPGFNDALTFWGYSGTAPTAVSTTKGASYTLGLDTRLSSNPFTVTPGDQLNLALWGSDGLRSSLYWNAVVARTNLCPNPSFENAFSGSIGGSATVAQDTSWALNGTKSIKITPNGSNNASAAYLGPATTDTGASMAFLHLLRGHTYTVSATIRLTAAQTGTLDSAARSIAVGPRRNSAFSVSATSSAAPNAPGVTKLSLTFTVPTDVQDFFIKLANGSANTAEPVWWDSVLLEEQTAALTSTNWLKDPSAEAANLPDWVVYNGSKQQVTTAWPGKVGNNSLLATATTPNKLANGGFEVDTSGWASGNSIVRTNLDPSPCDTAAVGQPSARYSAYESVSGTVAVTVSPNTYNNRAVTRATTSSTPPANAVTGGANGTFDGGDLTNWTGQGGVPPTMAAETTTVHAGTGSMKITWPATTAYNSSAAFTATGLTVGSMYVLEAWLYIPSGSCDASVYISSMGGPAAVTQRDQWVLSRYSFYATATSHTVLILNRATSTAGQVCYLDDVKLYLNVPGGNLGVRTQNPANLQNIVAGTNFWFSADVFVPSNVVATDLQVIFRDDPNNDSAAATFDPSTPYDLNLDQLASTNMAPNPNCETDISGWSSNNGAYYTGSRDTTAPISGTASYLQTRIGALDTTVGSAYIQNTGNTQFPILPSTAYTVGITLKAEQANRRGRVGIFFYDAGGTYLSGVYGGYTTLTANVASRVTATVTSPPTAAKVYIGVDISTVSGNAIANERTWMDELTFERGSTTGAYFEGGTASTASTVYRWTGTANLSPSEKITTTAGNVPRNQWVRLAWKATVKAGRTVTGIYISVNSPMHAPGTWIETTRWMVEASTASAAPDYFDGNGGRYNYDTNPDLEGGTLNEWASPLPTAYPIALDTTQPISGSYSVMSTRQAANPSGAAAAVSIMPTARVPCGYTPVTFGLSVRTEQAHRQLRLFIACYDAAGNMIGATGASFVVTDTVAGQVYRPVITATPLPNTTSIYLACEVWTQSGNAITGERCWFDNVTVEMGRSIAGNAGQWPITTPALTFGWTGTAGASTSTRTAKAAITRDTARYHYGAASMRIDLAASGVNILYPYATATGLTIGSDYIAAGWIYCPSASIAMQPWIRIAGVTPSSTVVTTADQWTYVSLRFTATATSHSFYIANSVATTLDGLQYWADDLAVFDATSAPSIYPLSTSPTSQVPANPGDVVSGQINVGAVDVALAVGMGIAFYDSGGAYLNGSFTAAQTIQPGQSATLSMVSAAAPANTAGALLIMYPSRTDGTAPPGLATLFDAAIVQVNKTITEYFDGSSTGSAAAYAWTGAANASPSTRQATDYFDSGFKATSAALYRWRSGNSTTEMITFDAVTTGLTANDGSINLAEVAPAVPSYATTALLMLENATVPPSWAQVDPTVTWAQLDPTLPWTDPTVFPAA